MELRTYISPLLKWWWLIVLATILAGVSSFLAVRQQPPTYQSRTTLMIGRTIEELNPSGTQFYLSQQLAQTYVDIARREPLRNATKEALGLEWLPPYSVNVLPNTQLIEILVADTSPERSYAVARELANQLILLSPSGVQQEEQERQDFINQQLNDLQVQIEETKAEIEAQQNALGELFSARQIADAQTQIAALESKRNTLQANYAALLDNTQQGAINALTIIENPVIPTSPISSNKMTTVITAAAIGFVLAASAAYLLEYLDDSVKTIEDIKKVGNIATLASIAYNRSESGNPKLITIEQPRSPISEAFRILRTNIQFSSVDDPPRKILVTSPNPGEGKTTITANLAVVIAQAGYKVLLIDADLRRPMQHTIFKLEPKPGLTELLLETNLQEEKGGSAVVVEKFIQKTAVPNLFVLASGVIPHNPSELLGSFRMRASLEILSSKYDFLIIDSPPVLALADSLVLSAQTDGLLLVSQANRTKKRQLRLTVEKLREVDAPLIGVTLNRASLKGEGYSSYYYYQANDNQNATITKRRSFNLNGLRSNGLLSQVDKEKEKELEGETAI